MRWAGPYLTDVQRKAFKKPRSLGHTQVQFSGRGLCLDTLLPWAPVSEHTPILTCLVSLVNHLSCLLFLTSEVRSFNYLFTMPQGAGVWKLVAGVKRHCSVCQLRFSSCLVRFPALPPAPILAES